MRIKILVALVLGIFLGFAFIAFNGVMTLWDDFMRQYEAEALIDTHWQQLVNAKSGALFEFADGSLCVIISPFGNGEMFTYRCIAKTFEPELIADVRAVYPLGSTEWKGRHAEYKHLLNLQD